MIIRSSVVFFLIIIGTLTHGNNALQVRLTSKAAKFSSTHDVLVTVVFKNTGDRSIRINKLAVPKQDLPDQLFSVTLDGAPVKYIGPVYKRVAPSIRNTIILEPGESILSSMSLSSAYDLSQDGEYSIRYDVEAPRLLFESGEKSKRWDDADQVRSNDLVLDVMGRENVERAKVDQAVGWKTSVGSNQYVSCSPARRHVLINSRSAASTYAGDAYSYLAKETSHDLERYPTWFGTYDRTRWSKVRFNYLKIRNVLNTGTIRFDCSCTDTDTYAYVYTDNPYLIYLCGIFWSAPLRGTDSQGGTLVHELSHFTVIGGTNDFAYGQNACKNLAIKSPVQAVQNAENYQYFAENDPPLP